MPPVAEPAYTTPLATASSPRKPPPGAKFHSQLPFAVAAARSPPLEATATPPGMMTPRVGFPTGRLHEVSPSLSATRLPFSLAYTAEASAARGPLPVPTWAFHFGRPPSSRPLNHEVVPCAKTVPSGATAAASPP